MLKLLHNLQLNLYSFIPSVRELGEEQFSVGKRIELPFLGKSPSHHLPCPLRSNLLFRDTWNTR
eukprot:m.7031 g.7031  ORF g.7031 m.7031 type:complete len:64 (+) comp2692_c0_seq1:117-308(+)